MRPAFGFAQFRSRSPCKEGYRTVRSCSGPSTPSIELCTRGYSVMLGYWAQPDMTAEAVDAAHWMHTGDLAVMDSDGYLAITGRIKDMVIRGGENVYPREIEEFLYTHPLTAETCGHSVRAACALQDPSVPARRR